MNKQQVRQIIFMVSLAFALCEFSVAFAEEFSYDNHGKRDPFVAPNQSVVGQIGTGELKLEGVIVDQKGGSYAVVNGEIVREGDTFQGYKLNKVESNQATFEKDGEALVVILSQDEEALRQALNDQRPNS